MGMVGLNNLIFLNFFLLFNIKIMNINIEYQRLNDYINFNKKITSKLIKLGGNITSIVKLNQKLIKKLEERNKFNNTGPIFSFPTNMMNNRKKYDLTIHKLNEEDINTPSTPIEILPIKNPNKIINLNRDKHTIKGRRPIIGSRTDDLINLTPTTNSSVIQSLNSNIIKQDAAIQRPVQQQDHRLPVRDESYIRPVQQQQDHRLPVRDESYIRPVQQQQEQRQEQRLPVRDESYIRPVQQQEQRQEERLPVRDESYIRPVQQQQEQRQEQRLPVKDESYIRPVQQQEQRLPVKDESYIRPVQQQQEQRQEQRLPVKDESYIRPVQQQKQQQQQEQRQEQRLPVKDESYIRPVQQQKQQQQQEQRQEQRLPVNDRLHDKKTEIIRNQTLDDIDSPESDDDGSDMLDNISSPESEDESKQILDKYKNIKNKLYKHILDEKIKQNNKEINELGKLIGI
jgi:hypothetical protein